MEAHEFGDGLPEEPKNPRKISVAILFLLLLPLGLLTGTTIGLYRYFNKEETLQQRASQAINKKEIQQILSNYSLFIGSRQFDTPEGRKNLSTTVKNLQGELQSNNSSMLSYADEGAFNAGGRSWQTLWADIKGTAPEKVFCVATSYEGAQNFANAAKLAIMISTAKSLAGEELDFTLRFIFLPKEQALEEQEQWIKKHCIAKGEKHLGSVMLKAENAANKKNATPEQTAQTAQTEQQSDVWRIVGGDIPWGQEMFKESRVHRYAFAAMTHGVLNDKASTVRASQVQRVENAAKSLRQILFTTLGGDR